MSLSLSEFSKRGGKARAASLSISKRKAIARKGAKARWGKKEAPAETPLSAQD